MIIQGSMRYSPSGRKRKTNAWKKQAKPKFVAQKTKKFQKQDTSPEIPSLIHSSKTKYKSEGLASGCKCKSEVLSLSSKCNGERASLRLIGKVSELPQI